MKFVSMAAALALVAGTAGAQAENQSYTKWTAGIRETRIGQSPVTVLLDSATLGGKEMEMMRITIPPGGNARGHLHGRVEVLYILSGELDHIVNGTAHHLVPGMVGIVRPGDTVIHKVTSRDSVKALVIWSPGGELARVAP